MASRAVTPEQVSTYLQLQELIEGRIESTLREVLSIQQEKVSVRYGTILDTTIDGDVVRVTTEEYWGGSTDKEYYDFPTAFLYSNDWHYTYHEDLKKAKEQAEQLRLDKLAEKKKAEEEKERKEFERLLAKFGDIYGERIDNG